MCSLNMESFKTNFHAPLIASANLSLSGLSLLVAKIVPHLATLAVLLQIAVGVVSLWQMLKRKPTANEKNSTSTVVNPPPNGM
jgi:hypothetical protein